jgi:hypothetical protein
VAVAEVHAVGAGGAEGKARFVGTRFLAVGAGFFFREGKKEGRAGNDRRRMQL